LLSAGRSIAVQGFNENASVLAMLGAYAALVALQLPLRWLMSGFGLAVATAIMLLMWREWRRDPSTGLVGWLARARFRSGQ
jgi:MFS transporter, LPLT family, lysophospholipid transporter